MNQKMKILFLCTGNSCRSQMAEGWGHSLQVNDVESFSAGISPKGIDPRAVSVMAEAGIDISQQSSKSVEDLAHIRFDHVITVCGNAHSTCPAFPGARITHFPFDDPPHLATSESDESLILNHYRRVRDEIRRFVEQLPGNLQTA